jgi:hypothetical protein
MQWTETKKNGVRDVQNKCVNCHCSAYASCLFRVPRSFCFTDRSPGKRDQSDLAWINPGCGVARVGEARLDLNCLIFKPITEIEALFQVNLKILLAPVKYSVRLNIFDFQILNLVGVS